MKTKAFFGGVLVSQEADDIARKLIQEFTIPKLYNLAFLLQINKCFDDHQTLRLWVQKLSDEQEQLDQEGLYDLARQQLMSQLNQNL